MPSRKQRRRRAKDRRHEYEYVYVDGSGEEVEPDPAELAAKRKDRQTKANASARGGARSARTGRAARRIEPPSWRRVGRRALLFAPLMLVVVFLLGKKLSTAQKVEETVILLAVFLPFSYLMDSLTYRTYRKRTGAAPPNKN